MSKNISFAGKNYIVPDDATDDEVTQIVQGDLGSSMPKATAPPEATISARPGGVKQWLSDLENDFRQGTTLTLPGQALRSMGARGIDVGSTPGAGDTLMSPLLGPMHSAQGVAESKEHPVAGPLKALGGLLETFTLPAAFMAPEAGSAAKLATTEHAGQALNDIAKVANNVPVDITKALDIANETAAQAARGGRRPKVISDFLKRTKDTANPVTYEEARDFLQNASQLTADEFSNLKPTMKRQMSRFADAMSQSVTEAAESVGRGQDYTNAIKEFANAKGTDARLAAAGQGLKNLIGKAIGGGAVGVGGTLGYKLVKALSGEK